MGEQAMKRYERYRALFWANGRHTWITVTSRDGTEYEAKKAAKGIAPSFWQYKEARPVWSSEIAAAAD